MRISPRGLRFVWLVSATTLVLAAGIAALIGARTHGPGPSTVSAVVTPALAEVRRVAPAPLLVAPLIDVSLSMKRSDPSGTRYSAANEMLSAVSAARPSPARTFVAPVYFGSSFVARPVSEVLPGKSPAIEFLDYLGDTDFASALRSTLPTIRTFRGRADGRAGRAIVVIVTDGPPDLPGEVSSPDELWPGIERAVAQVREAGAEIYLLGVADGSDGWLRAADWWRSVLGSRNVLLAHDAGGLRGLYAALARTALDLRVVSGSQLAPGKSMTVDAGTYSDSLVARVTALESGSAFLVRPTSDGSATPVSMASRGEQASFRFPGYRGAALWIENTGRNPLMVSLTAQTAVLTPVSAPAPSVGAPVDGLLLELCDGRGRPYVSTSRDPLALTATLDMASGGAADTVVPLELRSLGNGRYEARAEGRTWPASSCRLTVLTRSVLGETGRQDYVIAPSATPWAALVEPARPFSLPYADSVSVQVAVRTQRPSALAASRCEVSAELFGHDGKRIASTWLEKGGDGLLTAALPASVKDGVVRLTVVGPDGKALSSRDVVFRLRKTALQRFLGFAGRFAGVVAAVLGVVMGGALSWLLLNPPLSGSVLVRGSGRPQRFGVLGRRFGVVDLNDACGAERWLVLPAGRDSVRVLRFGLLPTQALLHRGSDVPFRGRVLRLV